MKDSYVSTHISKKVSYVDRGVSTLYTWVMWFFAALFFSYQFVIRVFPGLCVPEIMHKFQIDATEFGLLSSMYYYGYAGMQIPVALLLDRFGPRFIISVSCFICSVSIFLFCLTESWYVALFARLMIGAGSAAGFLGAFKIISLWFDFSSYPTMLGLTNTVGLMGAIYGGRPVNYLIVHYGWENVMIILGSVGLILSVLILLIVVSYNVISSYTNTSLFNSFKSIFSSPILILIALGGLLMVGPLEGFADVWGISYLTEVHHFEKSDASFITSFIFSGMIVGGPILAYFSGKFKNFYQIIGFCGFIMGIFFTIVLSSNETLELQGLCTMMFFIGILCCYQVLVFAVGASLVSIEKRSLTLSFLNCFNMLGGILFHTVIGFLMDIFWTGKELEGQRIYEGITYKYAVWSIPVAAFIGGAIFLFLNLLEKRSKQTFFLFGQTKT